MIPNRMTIIASRCLIAAVFAFGVFASSAPAQSAAATDITGVYNGTFSDAQGPRTLKLALHTSGNGALTGVFTLYLPPTSHDQAYSYSVSGTFDATSGKFDLRPQRWLIPPPEPPIVANRRPPEPYPMVGMVGAFDPGTGRIAGRISPGRGNTFEATRDEAESKNIATASAPPQAAEAVPPVPQPAAATGTTGVAPPPAAPAPGRELASPTAINGVYTGTYTCVDGTVNLKLCLKSTDNESVTGLFTFDLPARFGSRPATYKLTGRYKLTTGQYGMPNRYPFQFTTVEPLGTPAPDAYAMKGVSASFGKSPLVMGRDGQRAYSKNNINPDRISGPVAGDASVSFEVTRDQVESANLDSVMATQASAASVVSTNAPAALDRQYLLGQFAASVVSTTAPAAPVARLTSIDGVYNGIFARVEGPTKFKLTLTQLDHGALAGVFTVYLTGNSGTQAYTYSLKGACDAHGRFHLDPRDWDTVPPSDFEQLVIRGTFAPNVSGNTARISGLVGGPAYSSSESDWESWLTFSHAYHKFEATWDAVESANIASAIAAQRAVGPPAVAPLSASVVAAHAVALKTAAPAQLASKNLVRKSPAYWDAYRTDLIRQVFDGSFSSDMGDLTQFRILFCHYVELYSKQGRPCLPANHEPLTIVHPTVIGKDRDGNVVWETQGRAWTLEVDPRFAKYYEKYNASPLGSWGMPSVEPAFDVEKFFATETCQSAAMRQLGENLLRAAAGDLSLQQAGATIAGAAAETAPSLPPGRFAHLVDACNSWLRDPANARFKTGNDTQYCQCLGEKEEKVMTAEEVYYYANDFGSRFRDQILQPKQNTTDPEWPRLHPPIEDCRQ